MAYEWSDQVAQGIVALLQARLPALLTAIAFERSDGVALPEPVEYWQADKLAVHSVPAVEVWCGDSSRQQVEGTAIHYRHRFVVICTHAGSDEVEIDVVVRRLLLAVVLALDGQQVGSADTPPLTCGPVTYLLSDEGDGERPFARSGAVELLVDTLCDPTP